MLLAKVDPGATFESDPTAVRANLVYLVERFHSHRYQPSALELSPWTWLFESAEHVTSDPVSAWRTVCVGLITHPDFNSY